MHAWQLRECQNYGGATPFENNICVKGTPEQLAEVANAISQLQHILRTKIIQQQLISFSTAEEFSCWVGLLLIDMLSEEDRINFIENIKHKFKLSYHDIIQHFSDLGLHFILQESR
jgi:hypothetical protein